MMISYKDIKKAINSKIKTEFNNIAINSNDVKEGFERPSFFVQLDTNGRSSDVNQIYKDLTVRINYFPTDENDYSIELMDVQEQLEGIFELKLKVQDRLFNIDETNSEITDGVLEFSFDINFYDGREFDGLENLPDEITDKEFYEKHPVEKMEELEFEKE